MRFAPLAVLMLASLEAVAAPGMRSVSHSEWRIDQQQVTVRVEFPTAEGVALVGKRYALPTTENVGKYVLDRIGVSAGGQPCPATDQGFDLGKVNALSLGRDLLGFEIMFHCTSPGPFVLHNSVFMEDRPAHVDYAQVEAAGRRVSQLFTAARTSVEIAPSQPEGASAAHLFPLGAKHQAGSLRRVAALLAMLLLAGPHRRLLLGALAAGYTLSWFLAFSGLQPEVPYLEAAIGFVSVAVAMLLVTPAVQRSSHLLPLGAVAVTACGMAFLKQPAAGLLLAGLAMLSGALFAAERRGNELPLMVLGALFGVVDGFVLPGDFARLHLDRVSAPQLAAFDLGSLACAALVLAAAWAVARLVERSRLSLPRPATHDLATSLLSGFGLFWMLSPL